MSVKKHPIGKSLQFCSLFRQAEATIEGSWLFHRIGAERAISHLPLPPGKAARASSVLPPLASRQMGAERAISHHLLPPLCKGRWRTNVSRRGCRQGAGEGGLQLSARSDTIPTTPQSNPSGLPAPLTQGSQALRGGESAPQREPSPAGGRKCPSEGAKPCGGTGDWCSRNARDQSCWRRAESAYSLSCPGRGPRRASGRPPCCVLMGCAVI